MSATEKDQNDLPSAPHSKKNIEKEPDQQSKVLVSPHLALIALWASTAHVPPMKEPRSLSEGDRTW